MTRLPWRSAVLWGGAAHPAADARMFGLGRIERIERTLSRAGIAPVHRLDEGAHGLPPGLPAPTLLIHTRAVFGPRLLPWLAERYDADGTGFVVTDAGGAAVLASVPDPRPPRAEQTEGPDDVVRRIARTAVVTPPHDVVCFAPPPGPVSPKTPGLWRLSSKPVERWHLRGVRKTCFPVVAALADRGVHPDTVSWAGFMVASAGAATMIAGGYAGAVAGALLLYAGWVVDCMDGALSRLTFQASASGAALDTRLGRIAYLLTAIALGWLAYGVRGAWGEALTALVVMVAGGLLLIRAAGGVDRLAPGDGRLWRVRASFEHVLHRDNALVILVCAVFGRLDLFIWIAVAALYAALAVDVAILLSTTPDRVIE